MSQETFTRALLDPAQPEPSGLTDDQGRPAGKRFSVYRNNVAVSLLDALEAGFPATARLLGEVNFKQIAQGYSRENPPSSPLMMLYGGRFPNYIGKIPALKSLGYLPDVARLEYAMRQSYHAADATSIDPARLASLGANDLNRARLVFASSVKLVRSDWPILDIRAKALSPETAAPAGSAQSVLVARPEYDPTLTALAPEMAELLQNLLNGAPLAQALTQVPNAELGALLALLLSQNALIDIRLETTQ